MFTHRYALQFQRGLTKFSFWILFRFGNDCEFGLCRGRQIRHVWVPRSEARRTCRRRRSAASGPPGRASERCVSVSKLAEKPHWNEDHCTAVELLLTGRNIPAEEARSLGFVNAVVADDQVEAAALAMAKEMASHSPDSIRVLMQAIRVSHETGSVNRAFAANMDAAEWRAVWEGENLQEGWVWMSSDESTRKQRSLKLCAMWDRPATQTSCFCRTASATVAT